MQIQLNQVSKLAIYLLIKKPGNIFSSAETTKNCLTSCCERTTKLTNKYEF